MKKLIAIVAIAVVAGCKSPQTEEQWIRQKEAFNMALDAAQRTGAAFSAELNFRGIGEVYLKEAAGLDTGIDGSVTVHGNAQTEAFKPVQ